MASGFALLLVISSSSDKRMSPWQRHAAVSNFVCDPIGVVGAGRHGNGSFNSLLFAMLAVFPVAVMRMALTFHHVAIVRPMSA